MKTNIWFVLLVELFFSKFSDIQIFVKWLVLLFPTLAPWCIVQGPTFVSVNKVNITINILFDSPDSIGVTRKFGHSHFRDLKNYTSQRQNIINQLQIFLNHMHRKQLDQILMLSREKDIQSLPPIHALVPSMWTWGPFHREYTTVGCPHWPNQLSGKQIQSSFKKCK